jgi:hypothetical protein
MSKTGTLADELLKGAVDLRCHSGPSIMPRKLDHIELIGDAEAAGLHAVLFKDHWSATPLGGWRPRRRTCASCRRWASTCACMLIECQSRKFGLDALREYLEAAGLDRTSVGSDLGQPINPRPVEGFRAAIQLCLDLGFRAAETRALTSRNACRLMSIPPAYQSA